MLPEATPDLYVELGLPNLHPDELEDGMTEMVWDYVGSSCATTSSVDLFSSFSAITT